MTGDPPVDLGAVGPGAEIPPLTIVVDAQRMKTMAAILRDPYPVHWDPDAVRAAGLGDRPINQGPLNLGYVANMLMAWAGDDAVRRLTVRFGDRVVADDERSQLRNRALAETTGFHSTDACRACDDKLSGQYISGDRDILGSGRIVARDGDDPQLRTKA